MKNMPRVKGSIRIEAPAEQVFDAGADSRNEPSYNPAMREVEKLTEGPVAVGTRFRARMGKAGTPMVIELTRFQRPRILGSLTTSSMMQTSGTLTLTPASQAGTTDLSWEWDVRPRGWFRVLGPLTGPLGRRMELRIWTRLKRNLEGESQPS